LLSGILDLTATSTLLRSHIVPFERLLQTIASGALGRLAFEGEKKTATIALFFHFLIATTAATVYYAASRSLTFRVNHPLLNGLVYGTVVHLVMSRVVVPLSRAPRREFSLKTFFTQWSIHMVCVGLPIALVVARFRG
jgi:hypothetical protein